MSSSMQLYTEVSKQLEAFHGHIDRRRLANWVWIVVGMIMMAQHVKTQFSLDIRRMDYR